MSIRVSVCIATCGSDEWRDLALSWALPSVENQGANEVLCRHYPKLSVAEARNALVSEATGDYVIQVDGDDQLCDGYVDAIREAWEAWQYDGHYPPLFVPALGLADPDGVCLTTPSIPDWERWPGLNVACIGTALPREQFLEHGQYDPTLALYEDWDSVLRLSLAGCALVPVPDAVYCATRNPNGRNLAPFAVRQETYEKIRARYDMAAIPRNAPLP